MSQTGTGGIYEKISKPIVSFFVSFVSTTSGIFGSIISLTFHASDLQ
jgi:hypothetical protein